MTRDAAPSRLVELREWAERGQSSEGWDFAHLGVRLLEPLPWDYPRLAKTAVTTSRHALDLDTGGGERLSEISAGAAARTSATEGWPVNARLAAERLGPLGIDVVCCSAERRLPFRDGAFDLALNRHGGLLPAEIGRVLKPGGRFLTQQVGVDSWPEFRACFPRAPRYPDDNSGQGLRARFQSLGFAVTLRSHSGRALYPSLGQFVYQVAACPWELPDFDIEADLESWLTLEARCLTPDGLVVTETRYLLEARKPAGSS